MLMCFLLRRDFSNTGYKMMNSIKPYTKFSKNHYRYLKQKAGLSVILGQHILMQNGAVSTV